MNTRPSPPEVGRVTHCNVELLWDQDKGPGDPEKPRVKYHLQQEEDGRSSGYREVYCGFARSCVLRGLTGKTQYNYRLQTSFDNNNSPWSSPKQVTTKEIPITGDVLHKAILNWDLAKVENILELNDLLVDVPDKMGCSPLMVAAQKGFSSIVDVLLRTGADVHFKNSSGKDGLMMACFAGHHKVAVALLEHGASLHAKDQGGSTALHWAVDGDQPALVEWLLKNGANVDELDKTEWTPLMRIATLGGSVEVAKKLLKHRANVNVRDKQGTNVTMAAALCGRQDLVQLLVEHGADVRGTNMHGNTALDFADSFGRKEVVEYLSAIQAHTSKSSEKTSKSSENLETLE